MERTLKTDIEHNVAMHMLKKGLATMSEVARLRGVSRQYIEKAAHGIALRQARERHLKKLWRDLHYDLS